jgi:hypothetical protein
MAGQASCRGKNGAITLTNPPARECAAPSDTMSITQCAEFTETRAQFMETPPAGVASSYTPVVQTEANDEARSDRYRAACDN